MAYTEEEAVTLWCPFARVSADHGPSTGNHACNRFPDGPVPKASLCIASACMAWRWDDENEYEFRQEKPDEDGWEAHEGMFRRARVRRGFCGLAGSEGA